MSRKIGYFLLLLSLLLVNSFVPVYAENGNTDGNFVEEADPALKLKLSLVGQEYPLKQVTIVLEIDSTIDSNKVSVDWRYSSGNLKIVGSTRDIVSVQSGQITRVEKKFIPQAAAITSDSDARRNLDFSVRVEGFVADRRFLSATSFSVVFNGAMETVPVFRDYQIKKITSIAFTWILWISIISGIILAIVYALKRFMKYINTEDQDY